ncbi:MAG: UDP-N-acetylmuramoyl-L-alanyl-D-glutamate--2,6-diaminopimelate ligase [Chlamydiota bacterium]|nr:UDP-N-acetylmuramoyl-L-alanyl-D-glutamate--2,6-diaminopimelate ligase [Chlamydiota bacterium]
MKLKKILKIIPEASIKGGKEIEITGICSNSKIISMGNLFVARRGLTTDGSKYIPEAIEGGAATILTDIFDPTYKNITQIVVPNVQVAEALISSHFYGDPSRTLHTVGITGTNGKTTVAYLTKHILDNTVGKCGLIGTIEYITGDRTHPATHTTPDVTRNHKLLHEMVSSECKAAVMEVTSHALEQGRVDQIHFNVAVFTNLSQDHLDYHETMEKYCQAKNLLFRGMDQGYCVANFDDSYMSQIIEGSCCPLITYGIDSNADLAAFDLQYKAEGTTFSVRYSEKTYLCMIPLQGKHNVYNALAAIGVGLASGIDIELLIRAAATFPQVKGRLESIPNKLGIHIFVDFAHTDDALKNILLSLKEIPHRNIITVFGCGGNRDTKKRPKMAQIAEKHSSFCIVTSDNPRKEDPMKIIDDITAGFSPQAKYAIEEDRKQAIKRALEHAQQGDVVIIAGKGHEGLQILSNKTVEFYDAAVVEDLCKELAIH